MIVPRTVLTAEVSALLKVGLLQSKDVYCERMQLELRVKKVGYEMTPLASYRAASPGIRYHRGDINVIHVEGHYFLSSPALVKNF
jgi:hypothetical protein